MKIITTGETLLLNYKLSMFSKPPGKFVIFPPWNKKAVWLKPCWHKGERNYSPYSFLTLALDGASGECHNPTASPTHTHWIGGWVSLRAGLDTRG
jgi:hypothetical protein